MTGQNGETQFIERPGGGRLAYALSPGAAPTVVYFCGMSTPMSDPKALAIEARLDPDYRARALSEAAVAAARNAKLPTIDLFDDFEGRAELYYRGGDDHWSPAGQALAAERVAAELLGSGLLR